MVKLESAVSLASLGLIVMFILLLYSFISFLIGPMSQGPDIVVQPRRRTNTSDFDFSCSRSNTGRNRLWSR